MIMIDQTLENLMGDYIWVLGIGLPIGLSIIFTLLLSGDEKVFVVFLLFFVSFSYWAGLVELTILIGVLVGTLILIGFEINHMRAIH